MVFFEFPKAFLFRKMAGASSSSEQSGQMRLKLLEQFLRVRDGWWCVILEGQQIL
jgi:hypothetical protein